MASSTSIPSNTSLLPFHSLSLTMSDVPSDLFREILLRLPAESLLRFRTVCRDWRRTIDDPSFIQSHTLLQHSDTTNTCTLLLRDSKFCRLYSLSLYSLNHPDQPIHLTRIKTLVRSGLPLLGDLPTATCHGLILISHENYMKSWVIWNPLTRDFHTLSDPAFYAGLPFAGFGLGYDSAADDFKVVRIDGWYGDGKSSVFKTIVYSLKSGSSKMIKDCPCNSTILRSAGVYLNGALYWLSEDEIIALDLANEEYRVLPLPPLASGLEKPLDMYIDCLDGSLFVSCYYTSEGFWRNDLEDEECLEGWVRMEDGEMWNKVFSIRERGSGVAVMRQVRPVAYLKNRGHVFLQNDDFFYWLDVGKNTTRRRKVTIHGLPEWFTCQEFRGSLIRVVDDNGGVGGSAAAKTTAGVNRKKKKRAQTRLTVSATIDDWLHDD